MLTHIEGRVGGEQTVRFSETKDGTPVMNFRFAEPRFRRTADGRLERMQVANWYGVAVFGQAKIDRFKPFVMDTSKELLLVGQLDVQESEGDDGRRYVTPVLNLQKLFVAAPWPSTQPELPIAE